MVRISDPMQIDDERLRELAVMAAWVAKVWEAVDELEFLCTDLPDEERVRTGPHDPWPWDADPVAVALHLVRTAHAEGQKGLEERLAVWLGEDPEHWPILRLMLIDPWQEAAGQWHVDAPDWLRILGETAAKGTPREGTPREGTAQAKDDPFGRRPAT